MNATPTAATLPAVAALARGALGDSYSPEVPRRMVDTIAGLPARADVAQLLSVLRFADTRAGALLLTGRAVPISWLDRREAEAVLQRWKTSGNPRMRKLASALVSLTMAATYGHPGPEWERIGYPGPLGPPPSTPKRLRPLDVAGESELSCDVVVVGSGAGGGCVAAGLAAAGLDVIVVEKGGYYNESDFSHREANAMKDLYLYGGAFMTADHGVRILAGSALGGGTVVNYTTSFRTPDFVLREWARVSGVEAFVSGEFEESLDEVSARLSVNTDSSAAGRRDEVLEEGLKRLGWHVDMLPRAVEGCAQDEGCGYCGFGCRAGAKRSTMLTYLEDAAAHGARIVVDADVRRVMVSDGRATGVDVEVKGRAVRVRSKAVVAAGGAIETPALLLRSGVDGQVGHYLRLHPGTGVLGMFDDEIRMWEGTLQSRYSSEFRAWDEGYGPIFETVPVHPGGAATAFPWVSAEHHRAFMARFPHAGVCAVLPRDKTAGRVRIDRRGAPRLDYKMIDEDDHRIAKGAARAAQVLEAAGAREIMSLHPRYTAYHPDSARERERWIDETMSSGYYRGGATLVSYHQMGSCRMGTDPVSSAVDADHESHEVRGLFVADSSCFPTASGMNPMLSVYALANRAAKRIVERVA